MFALNTKQMKFHHGSSLGRPYICNNVALGLNLFGTPLGTASRTYSLWNCLNSEKIHTGMIYLIAKGSQGANSGTMIWDQFG